MTDTTMEVERKSSKSKKEKKKKDKKKSKKRSKSDKIFDDGRRTDVETLNQTEDDRMKIDKDRKEKKKSKKRKRKNSITESKSVDDKDGQKKKPKVLDTHDLPGEKISAHSQTENALPFDYKYILAPMVGASELPFRLLCRKYGATLAYTPMMSSKQFISDDPTYRTTEFQTIPEDRPLVAHFSANDPAEFAKAAKLVEDQCDAIDLNLGCPQRTAYVGHFGSYLLEKKDRDLVCNMVKAATKATKRPIFVKIRLLDTVAETIELCQQLREAGASLIAIHARYRASFERKGPGARDGPAMLDQVLEVKNAFKKAGDDFPIISNGNIITYDDVEKNLSFTTADGVMSAEGILDDPCLYLERYGDVESDSMVTIADPTPLAPNRNSDCKSKHDGQFKKIRKLKKKLAQIASIESKLKEHDGDTKCLVKEQIEKLSFKDTLTKELRQVEDSVESEKNEGSKVEQDQPKEQSVSLRSLHTVAQDRVALAHEYLDLADRYPTTIRTIVFHTRRMLKKLLEQYQLMEECVGCKSIDQVRCVIDKIAKYRDDPASFQFDNEKARRDKEALERKRHEEGKRKRFEARMIRKAKREGMKDLEYYLKLGASVPTVENVCRLRTKPKDVQLKEWKALDHTQHCMAFHLDACTRGRACAFLHVDATGSNSFVESDEVAG